MKRLFFLILLLGLSLCQAQTLLIGTTAHNPPFESLADAKDHFYGFDIDIMGAICQKIKLRCQFVPTEFSYMFARLKEGKLDLAVSAIIITPNREQEFLFSLPYLESNAAFMTLQQSPLKTPEDIRHKNIGVRQGTPFNTLANNLYQNDVKVTEFPRVEELLVGLNENTVDAVLMDALAAKNWVADDSGRYKVIGVPLPFGDGYGIMANKGQEQLMAQINQALLSMETDGTYLKIYNTYFSN